MITPSLEHLLIDYPETLTAAEVAAILRVHERSVQRWAREGRLSSVRVGRSYRFLRAEVLRWMRQSTISPPSPVEPLIPDSALPHPSL
jgi:excisionase family DNA binding protein